MAVYVVRRLLTGVIVVGLVSVVAFLGLEWAPGDELTARVGPEALAQMSSEQIQERRHEYGLDQPLPIRYAKWLEGALTGDLGYSGSEGVPVSEGLRQHLGPTLLLLGVAMLVGTVVALALGIIAALRRHTATDYVLGSLPILLIAIPGFVLSLAVIYLFSVYLDLLPTNGMHTLGDNSAGDLLRHLILPAAVLAIGFAAPLLRYTRASMIETLGADYVVTARA
jgi:peptide/nickel transport system permease protein